MERKYLFMCSQEPITGAYPRPLEAVHNFPAYVLSSVIISCYLLCLGFPRGLFFSGFGIQSCVLFSFSSMHATCPTCSYKYSSKSHYFLPISIFYLPVDKKRNRTSIYFPKTFYTFPLKLMFPQAIALGLFAVSHGYYQLGTKYSFVFSSSPIKV
jgi:hypothetical protein